MEEAQLLLEDVVSPDEIQRYRVVYEKAKEANQLTDQNKFAFAYCLVRSQVKTDVRHGLQLLKELYDSTRKDSDKRDYLFYLAMGKIEVFLDLFIFLFCLGNARLNEYETALKFLDAILLVQPGNHQAQKLKDEITRRMTREGCMLLQYFKRKNILFLFI
jgi:fission 1 protein